ncbi:MAG: hypothetical protein AAGD38_16185 [Acidobacteriota bacterium]
MMKTICFLLLILITCSPLIAEIPATLGQWPTATANDPVWVRADFVFEPTGGVNETFVGSWIREQLEAMIPALTSGCIDQNDAWIIDTFGSEESWDTLQNGIDSTANIFVGTVTDAAPGLIGEFLGTLMKLDDSRLLKRHPDFKEADEYYFHISTAEFELDGKTFCVRDKKYPALPEIGERVILFPYMRMSPRVMTTEAVVIERKDGTIEVSALLPYLPTDRPFDQLVELIESTANRDR